jgi:hypothetical protein
LADRIIEIYMSTKTDHDFVDDAFDEKKSSLIISLNEYVSLWGNTSVFFRSHAYYTNSLKSKKKENILWGQKKQ